jgi:hypothetical protein
LARNTRIPRLVANRVASPSKTDFTDARIAADHQAATAAGYAIDQLSKPAQLSARPTTAAGVITAE